MVDALLRPIDNVSPFSLGVSSTPYRKVFIRRKGDNGNANGYITHISAPRNHNLIMLRTIHLIRFKYYISSEEWCAEQSFNPWNDSKK